MTNSLQAYFWWSLGGIKVFRLRTLSPEGEPMNSRTTVKRISKNEQLVKRAKAMDGVARILNGLTVILVLVLLWQAILAFLGWDGNPDALLQAVKGAADTLANPLRKVAQRYFPINPGDGASYLLVLLVVVLANSALRLILKLWVRVPGAR